MPALYPNGSLSELIFPEMRAVRLPVSARVQAGRSGFAGFSF
jgi:hypothetical protein